MRRLGLLVVLLAVVGIAVLAVGPGPVAAEEHEIPPHPHMLVQRPEFGLIDGVPHLVGIRRCVPLANNRAVPLHSHHDRLHFGDAGVSFGGEAGHAVVSTAPFAPWSDCAEFEALIPIPVGE